MTLARPFLLGELAPLVERGKWSSLVRVRELRSWHGAKPGSKGRSRHQRHQLLLLDIVGEAVLQKNEENL